MARNSAAKSESKLTFIKFFWHVLKRMVRYTKGKYSLTVPEVEQIIENYNSGKIEKSKRTSYVPLYIKKIKKGFDLDLLVKFLKEDPKTSKIELSKKLNIGISLLDKKLAHFFGSKILKDVLQSRRFK